MIDFDDTQIIFYFKIVESKDRPTEGPNKTVEFEAQSGATLDLVMKITRLIFGFRILETKFLQGTYIIKKGLIGPQEQRVQTSF